MHEVADGVVEIRLGFVNLHLVVVDDGVVLVDTGLPGRAAKVEAALQEVRKKVGEVHTILLTHRHPDHVGSAAELQRRSGARVVAHRADAPVITGEQPLPTKGFMKVVSIFTKPPEPVPVDDRLLGDGPTSVVGFSAVHTPGHTPGHVSYLLDRDGGVLFAGDAASGGRKAGRTPRMFNEDDATATSSLTRLAGLEFDVAVFGHGRAVTGRAVEQFRQLAER